MKSKIKRMLLQVGVPQHLKGYNYLKTAVERVCSNPDELDKVTAVLYPNIAKEHNTTPSRVERAIRHAIECAFDNPQNEAIEELFGNSIPYSSGRPANSHFIAAIAEAGSDAD